MPIANHRSDKQGHWSKPIEGAFGAGLVLVFFPGLALLFYIPSLPLSVALPTVAIFGIAILLGALALVSALFTHLELGNPAEALGLPSGSIRAFIALSLIVVFALISVMLFESFGEVYKIDHLSEEDKNTLVKEPLNHVTAIISRCVIKSDVATAPERPAEAKETSKRADDPSLCVGGKVREYEVHLSRSRGAESADLSKQLLILVGTLMTSVTSFYFAARSSEANTKTMVEALNKTKDAAPAPAPAPSPAPSPAPAPVLTPAPAPTEQGTATADDAVDGCNVATQNPTSDADLPAAKGGVAS